ncbi:MAG: prepilin-type N-terminal cleavage/methylation domain-containing protein [Pseudomonadota bacterium]|nr:prepilin-type N-terminal cleavage/methylation domain-containing protein [Pseudomonadota bacterium]
MPARPAPLSASRQRNGFTVTEFSVAMVIFAIVAGVSIRLGFSMIESARRVHTANKLNAIETALEAYRLVNNRLPCPAEMEDCTHDAIAEGAVPVKALSLPEDFQSDGWGQKFSYAVWTPMTMAGSFLTHGIYDHSAAITVRNAAHIERSTQAIYTLGGHGPDSQPMRFRERWQMQNDFDRYHPAGSKPQR